MLIILAALAAFFIFSLLFEYIREVNKDTLRLFKQYLHSYGWDIEQGWNGKLHAEPSLGYRTAVRQREFMELEANYNQLATQFARLVSDLGYHFEDTRTEEKHEVKVIPAKFVKNSTTKTKPNGKKRK